MLKVALVGYGKMGKTIDCLAGISGVEIVARIHPSAGDESQRTLSKKSMNGADVCIHFTTPEAAFQQIQMIASFHIPLVIGTTGWYDKLPLLDILAKQYGIGMLYAQNFSLGMLFFQKILATASKIANELVEYDVCGLESHHRHKKDSPSGSAEAIAEILLKNIERKKEIVTTPCHQPIAADAIHFASLRCGEDPGTHTVRFDSGYDTITLTHSQRNREGLAKGALEAAKWIHGRQGVFHLSDMLEGIQ